MASEGVRCIITVVPHWSRRRLARPKGHRRRRRLRLQTHICHPPPAPDRLDGSPSPLPPWPPEFERHTSVCPPASTAPAGQSEPECALLGESEEVDAALGVEQPGPTTLIAQSSGDAEALR